MMNTNTTTKKELLDMTCYGMNETAVALLSFFEATAFSFPDSQFYACSMQALVAFLRVTRGG